MGRRGRIALALLATVIVLPLIAAPAAGRTPTVGRGAVRLDRQRTITYWTAARLASAIPLGAVVFGRGHPSPIPLASVTRAASWQTATPTLGGLAGRQTGRVYFTFGAQAFVCSGSVVTDGRTGFSLVLTAGHCAYDHADGWATNWMFIPQADGIALDPSAPDPCAAFPRGCWTAQALVAHSRFTTAGDFTLEAARSDYAFAVVGPGGLDSATGLDQDSSYDADTDPDAFQIGFSGVPRSTKMHAFGYPAGSPWNGQDLRYCAGPVGQDLFNANATWSLSCDMTGGASGGPWFRNFSTPNGSGTVSSLNSYRYPGSSRIFGPKFTATTKAVYDAANVATTGTIAVP